VSTAPNVRTFESEIGDRGSSCGVLARIARRLAALLGRADSNWIGRPSFASRQSVQHLLPLHSEIEPIGDEEHKIEGAA
jgi:hypothetical protein